MAKTLLRERGREAEESIRRRWEDGRPEQRACKMLCSGFEDWGWGGKWGQKSRNAGSFQKLEKASNQILL